MSLSETLPEKLRAHVEQMANTSWGLTIEEWYVISNDILAAARALEAASVRLVPVDPDNNQLAAGMESDSIAHPWEALVFTG